MYEKQQNVTDIQIPNGGRGRGIGEHLHRGRVYFTYWLIFHARKPKAASTKVFELCLDQFSTCCGNVTHQGLTEIPQFALGLRWEHILRLPYKFASHSNIILFYQLQSADNNDV